MRITLALVIDTFREALARWIFIGLFALSTLMILFFLFLMRIDIVEGGMAAISLFGQGGRTQDVERLVQSVYGGIAAFLYTWGMALAVFASAGLIPRVLEPGRIELILSKPVSRTHILLGRFLGNVLVVAGNIAYLVLGVWIIFGNKTGIWAPRFLAVIATTVFTFTVLLTVVVILGVLVESTALSTMITMGLMILSPILAQTAVAERLLSSETSRNIWRGLYYVFPKVYDIGNLTLKTVRGAGGSIEWMPLWSSALFGAVMLAGALAIFSRRDF
ncbi:MAG TPA: ABC transporter permease subunit [Bryobacteraceae bacterium]|nr:ABC transporter permease subunit [Bryobacteraceae bacterium]